VDIVEKKICVHLNGTNSEEWISKTSRKIALFRTHTTDCEGSYFLSPVPGKRVKVRLKSKEEELTENVKNVLEMFTSLFKETQQKAKKLEEMSKEIKTKENKNLSNNRYEKHFSATKKFMKNNDETRSNVSFKISKPKELKTLFDDSRSVQIENFTYKKSDRFKKKELENLSPKSIKSQMSGLPNIIQGHMDDNISQVTYGVIQEETHLDDSSEGSDYRDSGKDKEKYERAESIRAQKDFGLFGEELGNKVKEMGKEVNVKRRQLGVICDRLGRLLVDLAPHFMVDLVKKDDSGMISSRFFFIFRVFFGC
jgi:hypothetical protein